jgi:HSP20 family protein
MSNLVRWNPFGEMLALRSAMDRMFDEDFFGLQSTWPQPVNWNLALDVAETNDEFVVKASLPGMNPDDLEITFDNQVLTIKGEVKDEKETEERNYHLRERHYGSFSRSVSLPSAVKADAIDASYEAGVLTLHLPKAEEAKAKRIAVKSVESPKLIEGKAKNAKGK